MLTHLLARFSPYLELITHSVITGYVCFVFHYYFYDLYFISVPKQHTGI